LPIRNPPAKQQKLRLSDSATFRNKHHKDGGIRRAAERATGLMGGDWPGIDRVRGVNLC